MSQSLNTGSYLEQASGILNSFYSTVIIAYILFQSDINGCGTIQIMMNNPSILKHKLLSDTEKQLYMVLYDKPFQRLFYDLQHNEELFKSIKLLSQTEIESMCTQWIENVFPLVKQSLQIIIDRIETAAQLVELEEIAHKYAFRFFEIIGQFFKSNIDLKDLFQQVFSKYNPQVWSTLQSMFLTREKKIIHFKLSTVFLVLEKKQSSGVNIGESLWTQLVLSDNDMITRYNQRIKQETFIANPYNQFHVEPTNTEQDVSEQQFTLDIYINGITDRVKSVATELFERQLKPILEDLFLFIKRERVRNATRSESSSLMIEEEEGDVEKALYSNLYSAIERICNNIENDIEVTKDIDHQLFLAGLCQSIRKCISDIVTELLNHANDNITYDINRFRLMRTSSAASLLAKKRQKWQRSKKASEQQNEDQISKLFDLEKTLDTLYINAHRIWINRVSKMFVEEISKQVAKEDWRDSRKSMWREIIVPADESQIDEDRLFLPYHPSYCVHNALHDVNTSIYSIGAFEVEKSVLGELSVQLASNIFTYYNNFLKTTHEKQEKLLAEHKLREEEQEKKKRARLTTTEEVKQSNETNEDNPVVPQSDSVIAMETDDGEQQEQNGGDETKTEADELDNQSETEETKTNPFRLISEEGYLQLLFDIRFLGDILLGSPFEKLQLKLQASSDSLSQIEKDYVSLVELVLSHIDLITWETYEKTFVELVTDCVIRNRLFIPVGLSRQYNTTIKNKRRRESSIQFAQPEDESYLKLYSNGSHFNLLPIARRETKPVFSNANIDSVSSSSSSDSKRNSSPSVSRTQSGSGIYSFVGSLMGRDVQENSKPDFQPAKTSWGFSNIFSANS
jgi:hypothetical protein